jgi:hypothetical protein
VESQHSAISIKTKSLLSLDVNQHVEKKNGLSYLSWAWAWDEALRSDPSAVFRVESWTRDDGTTQCWMDVNGTAMVWVSVTMHGMTRTCMLPVMDHRNKPIQSPDAFQINTAIMRCMTKCLALFGLGLYIYAGEDLPPPDDEKKEEKKEDKKEEKKNVALSRDNEELFAQGMVDFVVLCKDLASLKSYWKANLSKLDKLKADHPDLYERVRSVFTDKKSEFEGEANA